MKKTPALFIIILVSLLIGVGGLLVFREVGKSSKPHHPVEKVTGDQTPSMQEALDKAETDKKEAYLESLSRTEVFLSPGCDWKLPYYSGIPNQKPFDLQFREIQIRFLKKVITKEKQNFDPYLSNVAKSAWGVSFDGEGTIQNGFSYYLAEVEITNLGEGMIDFGICPTFQLFSRYSYPTPNAEGKPILRRGAQELFGYNSEALRENGTDTPDVSDKSYYNISLQPKKTYHLVLAYIIPDAMAEEENQIFLYCDLPDSQSRQFVKDEDGKIQYLTPILVLGEGGHIIGEEWGGRNGGSFFPATEASLSPSHNK